STNLSFGRQSSTQAFTGLGTATDLIRGTAYRKLWSDSQLSVTALYERLNFSNQPGTDGFVIPFSSIRTDLRTRHTAALNTMLSWQYYRTGSATAVTPASARFETGSTFFNDLGGQVSYRLFSSVVVPGNANAAFVSTPF